MRPRRAVDAWETALGALGFVSAEAVARMQRHWQLVSAWNERSNLTAIRDEAEAAWLHYRDSLAVWPFLTGESLVDFGSGAGFPGLVLAMVAPALRVTLVEPRRRRYAFLSFAAAELGLARVRVLQAKAEDAPDGAYAHGVTRATFSAHAFLPGARAWLRLGGTLLCHRGPGSAPWGPRHAYTLGGPGPQRQQRYIDVLENTGDPSGPFGPC